jgi:hypothetical protein
MGSSDWDEARGVAVDGSGNVYVAGTSDASWGTPIHAHTGGPDIFAVKLNSSGQRQWHTFMGGGEGRAVAVDASGHVYVSAVGGGYSDMLPVYPPLGGGDPMVAKLNRHGARQWYTYIGSVDLDFVLSIAVDGDSNVYAVGKSYGGWGGAVNPYAGDGDVFVWKLDSSGERLWHTYLGSPGYDHGMGVGVDDLGNVYVSGYSDAPWGAPINPIGFEETEDFGGGFAAKLDPNGVLQWNRFLGTVGWGLAVDESRNIYVGWIPQFVKLDSDGALRWRISTEGGYTGEGSPIAVDSNGNVYLAGGSGINWGVPVNPYSGIMGPSDAWVAKFVGTADYNYTVAAVAHTPGVGTSLWRSKLGVLNRSGERADVTLSYVRSGVTTTTTESIAHGVLKTWDDAAVSLFEIPGNSSGPAFIDSTQPLVVSSRTYDMGVDGSFGSLMPGVTVDEDLGYGEIGVLTQLSGNNYFRTNVGLVNLVSAFCQVEVQVHAADGTEVGLSENVNLQAYGFRQVNDVFRSTGAGSLDDAYVTVEVKTPDCRVWGYGAVIDGVAANPGTDDATTIPLAIVSQ